MPREPEPHVVLGRALRELREERGLTQEAIAHLSDLHPTWISRVEGGRINPTWDSVARLCGALGVSLAELGARADRARRT